MLEVVYENEDVISLIVMPGFPEVPADRRFLIIHGFVHTSIIPVFYISKIMVDKEVGKQGGRFGDGISDYYRVTVVNPHFPGSSGSVFHLYPVVFDAMLDWLGSDSVKDYIIDLSIQGA